VRQSTLTFGVLLFMFVVFITVRGQLPAYLALFKSKKVPAKIKSSQGKGDTFQGGGGGFGGSGSSGSWDDSSSSDSSGQDMTSMFNSLETV
jgi:uncharacterized membrane protein YgcG